MFCFVCGVFGCRVFRKWGSMELFDGQNYGSNFTNNAFISKDDKGQKSSTYLLKGKTHRENDQCNGFIECFGNHSFYSLDHFGGSNLSLLDGPMGMPRCVHRRYVLNYSSYYWFKDN